MASGISDCGRAGRQQHLTYMHESRPCDACPRPQVCLYAFDCLHLNGETLIQRPLTERRAALAASIEEREGELLHAKTLVAFTCRVWSLTCSCVRTSCTERH